MGSYRYTEILERQVNLALEVLKHTCKITERCHRCEIENLNEKKKCFGCKKFQSKSFFNVCGTTKDGLRSYCKDCGAKKTAYYRKHGTIAGLELS